jgi:hypothetical protein
MLIYRVFAIQRPHQQSPLLEPNLLHPMQQPQARPHLFR